MLDFVITPTFAEQVTFLGAGQVDAGLIPYTSFVALFDAGAPVKIIAGGGIQGCILVAQPGLDSPEKLKGKTLGTFQMDTLEVLPFDWMKKHGVNFKDINVRYMGTTPEAVEAFKAGALDLICTIEPYGTALLNDVKGSVMLSDGHRHLRSRLHRLRAGGALRHDQAEPRRAEVADQGHDEGAVHGRDPAGRDAEDPGRPVLQDLDGERAHRDVEAAVGGGRAQPDAVHPRPRRVASSRWATSRRSPAATRSTGRCSSR